MTVLTAEPSSTKDKILETALRLYNEIDPSNVTTALLAEQVGIAEGNLHYHFRRKQDIISALFDRYEMSAKALLVDCPARWEQPFDLPRYQQSWFELIWDFRFLHRGSCQLARLPPRLRERGWTVQHDIQLHVRQTMEEWQQAGYLRLPEVLEPLIANLWIIAHFWMDYLAMSRGVITPTRSDLQWGIAQMDSLFKPYFTLQGQQLLDARI